MSAIKLDIGCGKEYLEGWTPVDRIIGKEAFPLDYKDGTVDEIRASHILEHFSYWNTKLVLEDWARVLKPGGILRVAVPNFDYIVERYEDKDELEFPVEQALMGAHEDGNDYHKAIFSRDKLSYFMREAGFGDIKPWEESHGGTAAMDVSLNLQGTKGAANPELIEPAFSLNVGAVMSVPRLGFQDTFFSIFQSLMPYRIPVHRYMGAYWGQCIERSMEEIADKHDAILCVDYDSVFSHEDVAALINTMIAHPEADAICTLQMSRGGDWSLFTKKVEGKHVGLIDMREMADELTPIATGHFGLTLIRVNRLKKMSHPWFKSEPNIHGRWGEGRIDDDIYFWQKWEKMGYSLYQANRIPIGHADLFIQWPCFVRNPEAMEMLANMMPDLFNDDGSQKEMTKGLQDRIVEVMKMAQTGVFQSQCQRTIEYWEKGKPKDVWK